MNAENTITLDLTDQERCLAFFVLYSGSWQGKDTLSKGEISAELDMQEWVDHQFAQQKRKKEEQEILFPLDLDGEETNTYNLSRSAAKVLKRLVDAHQTVPLLGPTKCSLLRKLTESN